MSEIPARWRAVNALLCSARANASAMRRADLPGDLRDEATRGYCRDVDALVAELGAIRDAGALPEGISRAETCGHGSVHYGRRGK